MSNFVKTFLQGKDGKNIGITTGIKKLDMAINGIQKKMTIGIVAAPKVGKTTLADFTCVLAPYLEYEKLGKLDKIHWIYFSYEIDRVSKEFKYAAFFMAYDYGIYSFTYKGKIYQMNQDYLMGKQVHELPNNEQEQIPIAEEHEKLLKEIYIKRIIPIFGEYDENNKKIRDGKIDFIEEPENPTGLNKYLLHYADQHGQFATEKYFVQEADDKGGKKSIEKKRIVGYTAKDPEKYTIILTDHVRKLRLERGFTLKQNIDKWLEYSTFLRNICHFTFVHICHSNRQLGNVDRLKFAGEFIFPTGDDVKDSGNLSEECTVLITMFNPNDEKYNLDKHFGVELKDFPDYRSIHVVESRYTFSPQHIQQRMLGGINTFQNLEAFSM